MDSSSTKITGLLLWGVHLTKAKRLWFMFLVNGCKDTIIKVLFGNCWVKVNNARCSLLSFGSTGFIIYHSGTQYHLELHPASICTTTRQ